MLLAVISFIRHEMEFRTDATGFDSLALRHPAIPSSTHCGASNCKMKLLTRRRKVVARNRTEAAAMPEHV